MLGLILALPVGLLLLLLCYFIHHKVFGDQLNGPIGVVRYLYLSKILVDKYPKSSVIARQRSSSPALTERTAQAIHLKASLESCQTDIREDGELVGQHVQDTACQEELHGKLSAVLGQISNAVQQEEAYVRAVEAKLKMLEGQRLESPESEEPLDLISATVIPYFEPDKDVRLYSATKITDMKSLAEDLRDLADQQLQSLNERICRRSQSSKATATAGDCADRCTNLEEDLAILHKLREKRSLPGFVQPHTPGAALSCDHVAHADHENEKPPKTKAAFFKRLAGIFPSKKLYDVAAVQSELARPVSD